MTYRNKKVLKEKGISVTESLTAKSIKMLEKARELHGFVNVWSQDGKMMFFDKIINKVNIFLWWMNTQNHPKPKKSSKIFVSSFSYIL